jgi:hypothetical protein
MHKTKGRFTHGSTSVIVSKLEGVGQLWAFAVTLVAVMRLLVSAIDVPVPSRWKYGAN